MRYTAKLIHEVEGLSPEECAVAEEAFCDCLAFALGGEAQVVLAYRAWELARRAAPGAAQPSEEELAAIARWQTAEADATYFALKPLAPDMGDAHFAIRPEDTAG